MDVFVGCIVMKVLFYVMTVITIYKTTSLLRSLWRKLQEAIEEVRQERQARGEPVKYNYHVARPWY